MGGAAKDGMKIKSFEFNLRELAGSMGDFGTLFPLAIGYIAVCGLDPAGFLVMMGLANVATGLIYKLPMPIEPMKVLAVVAIAQHWTPSLIYASGFAMGLVWILFAATGIIGRLAKITPRSVVRGIQATLGILLAVEALKMISTGWVLGIVAIAIVLVLRESRYAPAAVVLMLLGIGIVAFQGRLPSADLIRFTPPPFTGFSPKEVWDSLVLAGFAQIPLTITNATIATSALVGILPYLACSTSECMSRASNCGSVFTWSRLLTIEHGILCATITSSISRTLLSANQFLKSSI